MGDFGIAQICLNGHVATSKSNDTDIKQKFCSSCGQSITCTCQKCNTPIKGSYREVSQIDPPYSYSNALYHKPSYCYNCGTAFPWTQSAAEAANELIDFAEQLSESEKVDLKKSIGDLIQDTPKTAIAEVKFKKYALKAGGEIAKGLKDILIDLVSETVKKSIWHN